MRSVILNLAWRYAAGIGQSDLTCLDQVAEFPKPVQEADRCVNKTSLPFSAEVDDTSPRQPCLLRKKERSLVAVGVENNPFPCLHGYAWPLGVVLTRTAGSGGGRSCVRMSDGFGGLHSK